MISTCSRKRGLIIGATSLLIACGVFGPCFAKTAAAPAAASTELRFAVSFPADRSAMPLDGRLLVLISTDGTAEPRFQVSEGPNTQLVFGVDVDGLAPAAEAMVDASAFGYPLRSLAALPPGDYYVQALLHRYQTFHRADGHVVKLPWTGARASAGTPPRGISTASRAG